ncbi:hypothetical protein [Azospirillum largimobile]
MNAIANLIRAHTNGYHILLPSRGFIKTLISSGMFGTLDIITLKRIEENHANYAGLADAVKFTVLVMPDGMSCDTKERINQEKRLPISYFSVACRTEPSMILVENADSDGEFFKLLANCLASELGYSTIPSLATEGGGGGMIGSVYRRVTATGRAVYCIVDSDKKCPSDPVGPTAQGLKNVIRSLTHRPNDYSRLSEWDILDVHEAENYVPLPIVEDLFTGDDQHLSALEFNKRAFRKDIENKDNFLTLTRFIDRKEGITVEKIKKHSEDRKSFYKETLSSLGYCSEESIQSYIDDFIANRRELPTGGFGESLLQRLLNQQRVGNFRVKMRNSIIQCAFQREISKVIEMIIAFSACDRPVRT